MNATGQWILQDTMSVSSLNTFLIFFKRKGHQNVKGCLMRNVHIRSEVESQL